LEYFFRFYPIYNDKNVKKKKKKKEKKRKEKLTSWGRSFKAYKIFKNPGDFKDLALQGFRLEPTGGLKAALRAPVLNI
jgi:hypothetical protein